MSLMPSFIQSVFNDWADRVEREANFIYSRLPYTSDTTKQYENGRSNVEDMFKKARVLRWAGVHYVNLES